MSDTCRNFRALAISLLLSASAATSAAELPHGVAAGEVTPRSAVLWARAGVPGLLRFELSQSPDFSRSSRFARQITDATVPGKVWVSDLAPAQRYYYRATDALGNRSSGTFRTAPAICADSGVHFGLAGDWRAELAPYPAIRNVAGRGLDFFILGGDTIYAENYSVPSDPTAANLGQYRQRYIETLSPAFGLNTWVDVRSSTPVMAMIDDHEVVNDFAGGASPASDALRFDQTGRFINETQRYRDGIQAFRDYMPVLETAYGETGDPRTAGKPRLYRTRIDGNAAITILLDNRSFRDEELPAVANVSDPQQVGAFLAGSFNPARTMLGNVQLRRLLGDLQRAEAAGIVWKFVFTPEPIENLGVLAASDRFEGYAAERSMILDFIRTHSIRNVVFLTADIHGTVVNNLTYQTAPFTAQIPVNSWEISAPSVAFDEPFGQTVVELATALGLVSAPQKAFYDLLPIAPSESPALTNKDAFLRLLVDQQLAQLGYDPLGLVNSPIDATLLQGGYVAAHTYGWIEFAVNPATKELHVTTHGIPPYNYADLHSPAGNVTAREPSIQNEFTVRADLSNSGASTARAAVCRQIADEG